MSDEIDENGDSENEGSIVEGSADLIDESDEGGDDAAYADSHSAKDIERQQIQAQIDAFIQGGGQIVQVDSSVMADPPRKPTSNYGGQPI